MPLVLFRFPVFWHENPISRAIIGHCSALNHAPRIRATTITSPLCISRLISPPPVLSLFLSFSRYRHTKHSGVLYRFHCFWSVYNARRAKRVTAVSTFAFPSNVDSIPFRCLSAPAKAFTVCEKFPDQLH